MFFDIEVDPMRDHCYFHGFVKRVAGNNDGERFVAPFADEASPDAYYYSKYELTIYRKLQERYPDVCGAKGITALFNPAKAAEARRVRISTLFPF